MCAYLTDRELWPSVKTQRKIRLYDCRPNLHIVGFAFKLILEKVQFYNANISEFPKFYFSSLFWDKGWSVSVF